MRSDSVRSPEPEDEDVRREKEKLLNRNETSIEESSFSIVIKVSSQSVRARSITTSSPTFCIMPGFPKLPIGSSHNLMRDKSKEPLCGRLGFPRDLLVDVFLLSRGNSHEGVTVPAKNITQY